MQLLMEEPSAFYFTDTTHFVETKANGEKEYYIKGYISTYELDRAGDIVTKNCMHSMLTQLKQHNIKLDLEHEAMKTPKGETKLDSEIRKSIIPIGRFDEADIDEKGLFAIVKLNKKNPRFDEIWYAIENKFLDAFSIAYIATQVQFITRDGKRVRLLDDVILLNVALTGNPVNTEATLSGAFMKSLKSMDGIEDSETKGDAHDKTKRIFKYLIDTINELLSEKESIDLKNGGNEMTENKGNEPAKAGNVEVKHDEKVAALETAMNTKFDALSAEMKALSEKVEKKSAEEAQKETKSMDENKELKSKLEALEAELKSVKDSPVYKGLQTEMNKEVKSGNAPARQLRGPIDLIG